jgi:hypothetical protein
MTIKCASSTKRGAGAPAREKPRSSNAVRGNESERGKQAEL